MSFDDEITQDEYAKRLGVLLVALRRNTPLTQEAAAAKLGVTEATVGRWERGEALPNAYELRRIYDIYDGWVEWLLDPPPVGPNPLDVLIGRARDRRPD